MNRRVSRQWPIVAVAVWLTLPLVGRAQATGVAATPARSGGRDATAGAALLARTFGADLEGVTLAEALADISAKTGVRLTYSAAAIPLAKRVSLVADRITVGDALAILLLDTGCRAVASETGHIRIELVGPDQPSRTVVQQEVGTITGRVLDAKNGDPVEGASVAVETTNLRTSTTADGHYTIRQVHPGVYRLTVRSLGHTPATRQVAVTGDSVLRVDFALVSSATMLDEVVTTVSGNQALKELGNSIGTINVQDSVIGKAPITDLADVLNARVAGVQVFLPGGLTGASPQINIRGQNSALLSNQPLLVIDGVRVANGSAALTADGYTTGAGRFNDLLPEEIASIEVVKGPSAATLYGTDAANGVIVVTTKRGERGRPRWSGYVEDGVLAVDRNKFPLSYAGWGHSTDAAHTLIQPCTLTMISAAQCVQDSVTSFSPLRYAPTTPIGNGTHHVYGGQVSGGGDTRYFFSGTYQQETGYLKFPDADKKIFLPTLGAAGLSSDQLHPNGLTKYSLRNNVTTSIGSTVDANVAVAFISQQSRIPYSYVVENATGGGPGYRDTITDGWSGGLRPGQFFIPTHEEDASHFTGGATGAWRPVQWFAARATTGIDLSMTYLNALFPPNLSIVAPAGSRTNERTLTTLYSIDASATASFDVSSRVMSRTSAGVQYHRARNQFTEANATQLSLGCQVVSCGISTGVGEGDDQSIVAGVFLEQTFAVRERLYLTGAARYDGASSFGTGIKSEVYPKASLSWLLVDTPLWPHGLALNHLRLRAAYGASGVQPGATTALATEFITAVFVDGQPAIGTVFNSRGNPRIRPERQHEVEGGFDADAFGARVHLEGTYYNKRSTDALFAAPFYVSQVVGFSQENLGSVLNEGVEGLVTLQLLDGNTVSWSVGANASYNRNRLLKLGSGVRPDTGAYGANGYVPGYPIGSLFGLPYMFADNNHNGIIEPGEVTLGTQQRYFGTGYPPVNLTATTAAGFFGNRLHISVQVDHRGGFTLADFDGAYRCGFGFCAADFERRASLASQAAGQAYVNSGYSAFTGYYRDGSFTRLREVAATLSLPEAAARAVHAHTATLTLSGRNLALWTRYTGTDPEVNGGLSFGSGQLTAFNDVGSLPPAQYWLARLNITF